MQSSRNIKFVAYLRLQAIHPDKVEPIGRSKGKAMYSFKMNDEDWRTYKTEFDRSEFLLYAQCLDAVSDLAY